MRLKCANCGQILDTRNPLTVCEISVGACVMSTDEYALYTQEGYSAIVRARYKLQQVYTHVDVYSPPEMGENLLYRVKL